MATKYLDLDAIAPDDITVRLNGRDHKYKEMSVADFLWATREAEKPEEKTPEAQFGSMTSIVKRSFPSITDDDVKALSLTKLKALVDFVLEIGAPKNEEGAAGGEGKAPSPEATAP